MVLGIRSKAKKGSSIQVEYLIRIQEIKPWPPSQSLKALRSVLLQWENGDRHSGCIKTVSPSNGSGFDGKIEFDESFKLSVTFSRELSTKGVESEKFQKNPLELNLYEPRRDKTVKGQLLGTVVVDLAEYAVIKDPVNITANMNCKRNFRNTSQPVLYMKIQPYEGESSGSSSKGSLSRQVSSDNGKESVSALMSEEYAEEAEVASFTDDDDDDDDAFSHCSQTVVTNSPPYSEENADSLSLKSDGSAGLIKMEEEHTAEKATGIQGNLPDAKAETNSLVKEVHIKFDDDPVRMGRESIDSDKLFFSENECSSQVPLSEALPRSENPEKIGSSQTKKNITTISDILLALKTQSSSTSSSGSADTEARLETSTNDAPKTSLQEVHGNNSISSCIPEEMKTYDSTECTDRTLSTEILMEDWPITAGQTTTDRSDPGGKEEAEEEKVKNAIEKGERMQASEGKSISDNGSENAAENNRTPKVKADFYIDDSDDEAISDFLDPWKGPEVNGNTSTSSSLKFVDGNTPAEQEPEVSRDNPGKQVTSTIDTQSFNKGIFKTKVNSALGDRLNYGNKSVRSVLDCSGSIKLRNNNQLVHDRKELSNIDRLSNGTRFDQMPHKLDATEVSINGKGGQSSPGNRIKELQVRIEKLESELREAATVEVALYSVVAEHGSSVHKVHTPARRLSRMYIHAYQNWSVAKRASTARSIVSGLVLVSKACGNDVPRLMYWLSNSVVLRTVISQSFGDLPLRDQNEPHIGIDNNSAGKRGLKWKESSYQRKKKVSDLSQLLVEWQNPTTFTSALEKIELWIFNRLVESIWWQTLTSYMHYPIEDGSTQSRKPIGKASALRHDHRGSFSIQLWKKAFRDAFERICPVRAGGHDCGCLPILTKLVMEQCVARLDVAMFNAILRESADEIPMDPVSDPISGSGVLPIPCGNFSFGAGAQLKNAIGTWSRWLGDLFGIDDDDSIEDEDCNVDHRRKAASSFKAFHLLNALSDLLMLPKDMLLDASIRKEVCPALDASIIRRVLSTFAPDEFCPDRVPEVVLRSLDSENALRQQPESIETEAISIYPVNAAPIKYSPPPLSSVSSVIGDVQCHIQLKKSTCKILRKCPTSDDELNELDSPLASIIDKSSASPARVVIADKKIQEDMSVTSRANAIRYQLLREVWVDVD